MPEQMPHITMHALELRTPPHAWSSLIGPYSGAVDVATCAVAWNGGYLETATVSASQPTGERVVDGQSADGDGTPQAGTKVGGSGVEWSLVEWEHTDMGQGRREASRTKLH